MPGNASGGVPGLLVTGRYRLVASIGQGGMGRVWRAADEMLDRQVAVKEIRIAGLDTEDVRTRRERTLREARATARIDHPNVVRIYDVVDEGDRLWIVMELVVGRSLEQILVEDGPLAVGRTARIGLELVAALRQVHAGGVLHRDIKPGNVLVEDRGQRVVLTDFGIAAIQDAEALTMVGMLVGSPDYMAPERISGRPQGPPSDIWSLGATLCAALGGHSPFSRSTTLATLHAVLYEEPELPPSAGELTEVLMALLAKEPSARPGLEEVGGALGRIAGVGAGTEERSTGVFGADVAANGAAGKQPGERVAPAPGGAGGVSSGREEGSGGAQGARESDTPAFLDSALLREVRHPPGASAAGAGGSGAVPGRGRPTGDDGRPAAGEWSEPIEDAVPVRRTPTHPNAPAPREPATGHPATVPAVSLAKRAAASGTPAVQPDEKSANASTETSSGHAVPSASVGGAAHPRTEPSGVPAAQSRMPTAPSGTPLPHAATARPSAPISPTGDTPPPQPREAPPHAVPQGTALRGEPRPHTGSPGSGLVPPGSGSVSSGSGLVPPGSGSVSSGSGLVPPGSGSVSSGSGVIAPGSGPVPPGSGTVPSGSGLTPPGGLPGPVRPSSSSRNRRRRNAAASAAVVGLVVAGGVLGIVIGGGGSGSHTHGTSAASPHASVSSGSPGSAGPSSLTPTVEGTSRPPGARTEAGLYAWVPPQGWQRVAQSGAEVHYSSPDRTQEIVANATPARGDLLQQWQQAEQVREKGLDYQRIRLEKSTFRGAPAVVWEYTVTAKGRLWHVRLLGFRAHGTSYEISTWYHPDVEDRATRVYDEVKNSFTPL
ncbi:protein kinase [Streptomyces sp. NPDC001634]|uniref:serine/threonine-protein kinase n=1 Tax=Streptomyces sp. NPDC001634 TaxID=3154390 RepID=UPI00331A165E